MLLNQKASFNNSISSVAQLCPTLCDPMNCSTPGLLVHQQLPESTQTHVHWVSDAIQPSHPSVVSFSSCPQSFPTSGSFPISHFFASGGQSTGVSGLISFRMDWLDLLAVQGTLKSLLQYHSSKASVLWRSVFFIVQLSHPYMTTRKTIALTRQTFVGKGMSLLFNMLSSLVIAFLPRSKGLLISWLRSQMRSSLCLFHILRATHVKIFILFLSSPQNVPNVSAQSGF